jgi:hypothetical protein
LIEVWGVLAALATVLATVLRVDVARAESVVVSIEF